MDRVNHVKIMSPDPEAVHAFLTEVLDVPTGWSMGPIVGAPPDDCPSPARRQRELHDRERHGLPRCRSRRSHRRFHRQPSSPDPEEPRVQRSGPSPSAPATSSRPTHARVHVTSPAPTSVSPSGARAVPATSSPRSVVCCSKSCASRTRPPEALGTLTARLAHALRAGRRRTRRRRWRNPRRSRIARPTVRFGACSCRPTRTAEHRRARWTR